MPKNEHLKGFIVPPEVVSLAAVKAEAVVRTYPTHFYDIEEAKAYISAACRKADFKYMASKCVTSKHMTDEEVEYVKDKVCFIVAVRAFKQGEFCLKIELADPKALRAVIEADIQRLLPLVPYWPSRFSNIQDALIHVDGVACWKQFTYTRFEGVEQRKFRHYVNFNATRHAFEAGRFAMDVPVEGWRRRQSKSQEQKQKSTTASKTPMKGIGSMKKAIESDIQRLLALISPWPTNFSSLNAARDYISRFTQSIRFPFTHWPDVEPSRFRLFVNFNTAKRAFELEKFEIFNEVVDAAPDDADETAVEGDAFKDDDRSDVTMLASDSPSTAYTLTPTKTPRFSAAAATPLDSSINPPHAATTNMATLDISTTATTPVSPSTEPSQGESTVHEIQEITMPPGVEIDEDPFKDLIATLKRESILRMAFE